MGQQRNTQAHDARPSADRAAASSRADGERGKQKAKQQSSGPSPRVVRQRAVQSVSRPVPRAHPASRSSSSAMAAPRALLAAVAVAALASVAAAFNETRVMTFNVLCQACVGDNYGTYVDEARGTGRGTLAGERSLRKDRRAEARTACWRKGGGAGEGTEALEKGMERRRKEWGA